MLLKTNSQIKGDLSVCCSATVAGQLTARGSATMKGNLKVEGWLDARNLRTPCKGLFSDPDSLLRAYPDPLPGWWALVGKSIPASIYVAHGRRWIDTGETGGDTVVDLDAYDSAIDSLNDRVNDLSVEIHDVDHPISVTDTAAADLIIADEGARPIVTFANGHIRTASFDSSNIQASSAGGASGVHPVQLRDISSAELIIADENEQPVLSVVGGHLRTANFDSSNISASAGSSKITLPGRWCALGTSITAWDIERANGIVGYQGWVRKRISFTGGYVNKGVNSYRAYSLATNLDLIVEADYYTLEFGTNDFLGCVSPGTMQDYTSASGAETFYGAMRVIIDRIYQVNPAALVILCTPRKCRYASFGVPSCHAANSSGVYIETYVQAVRDIAAYESFPVADFYGLTNTNDHNLAALSNDDALHPNTLGHKLMAAVLTEQFRLLKTDY